MYASRRSARLPHYVVNELATVRHKLAAAGVDVIDLSAGDLDLDPPELAVRALREALADPRMSRYSFQVGLLEFREAIARYMARRFGVTVDPVSEVLPLMGAKDGLSHFPLALLDPGDMCIVPESGYPAYAGGAILADARLETVSLESR
ncbi:MAG: aminotransferase class I/II-fold pyridoxal phosphate-dependent enzyme, partial [Gemmatimonadales bacterium]